MAAVNVQFTSATFAPLGLSACFRARAHTGYLGPIAGSIARSAPVITVTPSAGTPLAKGTFLTVDAVDATGLQKAIVTASFTRLGIHEVVWDGDNFAPNYQRNSTSSLITNGRRFQVLREAGWPESPTFKVTAIDVEGTENA